MIGNDQPHNQNENRMNFRDQSGVQHPERTRSGEDRSFARPMRPVARPEHHEDIPNISSGDTPADQTQRHEMLTAMLNSSAPSNLSETRRLKPVSDQTQLNPDLKRILESNSEKNPIRITDGNAPKTQEKKSVRVSASNKNAQEMEKIFRKEARLTELPGSRSYIPYFMRLKRQGPAKRYRLKGFANKEYVKQQRKAKTKQIERANRVFWIVLIIGILVVFYWLNPIEKLQNIIRMFGN